ncbi:MAG: hypothetical protein QF535_16745, partial [Anaerolineales bacterium]|nr:hypothetical protein [Anaerolineales bacterium]
NFVRAVDVKWDGYLKEPYYSEKITLDLRQMESGVHQDVAWHPTQQKLEGKISRTLLHGSNSTRGSGHHRDY